MEISITRGLVQLTLLDKRINKKIHEIEFVAAVKNNSTQVLQKYTREEFANNQKAEYQSLKDLMALRAEIKSKIVLSNASTYIQVGEHTYTVAEAIERKNSIQYDKDLLSRMESMRLRALAMAERENEKVEDRALDILKTLAGKDSKNVKVQDDSLAKTYIEDNSYTVLDPLNTTEEAFRLDREIDIFLSNVDFALSESNAITKITLSLNPDLI